MRAAQGQPLVDEINALFARLEKALYPTVASSATPPISCDAAGRTENAAGGRTPGGDAPRSERPQRTGRRMRIWLTRWSCSAVSVSSLGVDTFGDVDLRVLAEQAVAERSLRAIEADRPRPAGRSQGTLRVHGHQSPLLEALGNLSTTLSSTPPARPRQHTGPQRPPDCHR